MVEAIFFDVDGTLVNFGTNKVSDGVKNALRKLNEKGIKIFIATGRHSSKLDCLDGVADFTAFITVNGQICFNATEDIYLKHIPEKDVLALIDKMDDMGISCCFLRKNKTTANFLDEHMRSLQDMLDLSDVVEQDPKTMEDLQVYQLVASVTKEQEEELLAVSGAVDVTRWNPEYVDLVPKGGNKWVGIEQVLAYYGIAKENTMAFGDGENDMGMLQYVQVGVAMGNAKDMVKDVADYITDSVENDGVVKGLEYFGLL